MSTNGFPCLRQRSFMMYKSASVSKSSLRLSVIIPNFNAAAFVQEAIRSALGQTMSFLEVIVIDDGSTDDSLEKIRAISDPRLTVVSQDNHGLAGARNTGIMLARAPYVGFLDSDDIWYSSKAARHLAVMDADDSVSVTFSHSAYIDEQGRPTGQLLFAKKARPTARELMARNQFGNGSTPIVRRRCFDEVGVFDEGLPVCADHDMWVRIAACTASSPQLIPQVLTGYRIRNGSLSMDFTAFVEDGRRLAERFRKYLPSFTAADARRCQAEVLRIASRKALANGQVILSRQLLHRALAIYPSLVLRDFRATAMAGMHLAAWPLPSRLQAAIYPTVALLLRQAHAAFRVFTRPSTVSTNQAGT